MPGKTTIGWTSAGLKQSARQYGVSVDELISHIEAGEKRCTKCKHWKPLEAFYIARERKDGHTFVCKECSQVKVHKPPNRAKPGKENINWKGGRSLASNGYVLIKMPSHPSADVRGYVYEHRLVAEKKIGRSLSPGEQVHHLDGNKQNNSPDNLEVTASIHHHQVHHRKQDIGLRMPDESNVQVACACGCGCTFWKFDSEGRPRKYISGHNGKGAAYAR